MSDTSPDHAEWAVRLQDDSIRLRCTCGWQEQVLRTEDIARACVLHKPLVPQQGEGASGQPAVLPEATT